MNNNDLSNQPEEISIVNNLITLMNNIPGEDEDVSAARIGILNEISKILLSGIINFDEIATRFVSRMGGIDKLYELMGCEFSAIDWISALGNKELIESFGKQGVNFNQLSPITNDLPIETAISHNNVTNNTAEAIRMMCRYGALIQLENGDEITQTAIELDDEALIELLSNLNTDQINNNNLSL